MIATTLVIITAVIVYKIHKREETKLERIAKELGLEAEVF